MSLNIQTPTGLLEIGGKVTKEKVIEALGYEPVDKAHIEDMTVHVTPTEKQTWNNKSDFSGFYADLPDAPRITEDESGEVVYADESGNIIAKIGAEGFETTNITADSAIINGIDVTTKLDELSEGVGDVGEALDSHTSDADKHITAAEREGWSTSIDKNTADIGRLNASLSFHTSDEDIHITTEEREIWNNKSDFSGDYNDLENAPDITENESGEVVYADQSGNVIAKISADGFETTQVAANAVIANGVDLGSTLSSHTGDDDIHITDAERTAWNEKASTTYVDEQLAALVNSAPDKLNTLDELAAALGDDENFATTVTNSLAEKASKTEVNTHTSDTMVHITDEERNTWNAKSDFDGDYNSLTNAPGVQDDETNEFNITDRAGNVILKVDESGLHTTNVDTEALTVAGVDIGTKIDSVDIEIDKIEGLIDALQEELDTHGHEISDVAGLQDTFTDIQEQIDKLETIIITVTDGVADKTLAEVGRAGKDMIVQELFSYEYNGLMFTKIPLKYRYSHVKVRSEDGYFEFYFYCVLDGVLREYKLVGSMSDGGENLPMTAVLTEINLADIDDVTALLAEKAALFHEHTVEDISDLTATATELNYVGGVTSAIQIQLDNKADKSTTLEGYGITDTYTKTAVDEIAENLQTNINSKTQVQIIIWGDDD